MLVVVLGLLIVAVPIYLAARTVHALTRKLGAVSGTELGDYLRSVPEQVSHAGSIVAMRAAGSIADRLLGALRSDETECRRELALAEAASDIERDVVEDVRVPRVAASLATTGGLFAAALVMRQGLTMNAEQEGVDIVTSFQTVIERGLTLAFISVFGGVICAYLHRVAQQQRRLRLRELDDLLAVLHPMVARINEGLERPSP